MPSAVTGATSKRIVGSVELARAGLSGEPCPFCRLALGSDPGGGVLHGHASQSGCFLSCCCGGAVGVGGFSVGVGELVAQRVAPCCLNIAAVSNARHAPATQTLVPTCIWMWRRGSPAREVWCVIPTICMWSIGTTSCSPRGPTRVTEC